MARKFRGEGHLKVDSKGRVSIPAGFRRVVEKGDPDWTSGQRPNLIIVYGLDAQRQLDCYTIEAMDEIETRIARMQPGSIERKMAERVFHGRAMDAQIDEDGRIVLPKALRDKIGLDSEAFFIAAGDHFEIWKPETYAATEAARAEAWMAEQDADFDIRTLLPALDGGG
ncbi:MAG: division/cell wall cluster transcriptional repressor MraZ [Rhodobacteraceae bacterium]|nr:division/cell wall cluster transcriptional repressor MraZ [Paracoccaceae bacterium]